MPKRSQLLLSAEPLNAVTLTNERGDTRIAHDTLRSTLSVGRAGQTGMYWGPSDEVLSPYRLVGIVVRLVSV